MLTYKDACDQLGYDRSVTCSIKPNTVYFGYKNGEVKEFATRSEALTFSKNVETVVKNKIEIDKWWDSVRELESKAYATWYASLKADYIGATCSEALFNACYNEAYERGHSNGCDEITEYMREVYAFSMKVRSIE